MCYNRQSGGINIYSCMSDILSDQSALRITKVQVMICRVSTEMSRSCEFRGLL